MFNDKYGLTQAVLEGRKTMTRRIITDKKLHYWNCSCPDMVIVKVPDSNKINTGDNNVYFGIKEKISDGYYCDVIVSPYKLGEVVAIAQSYSDVYQFHRKGKSAAYLEYLVSMLPELKLYPGWGNKMFVQTDLMPHHIKITGIKVERLQDISDEDCLKEGIIHAYTTNDGIRIYHTPNEKKGYLSTDVAQEAFAYLIDKVSGNGTWESNPYVFAYEFKLVD